MIINNSTSIRADLDLLHLKEATIKKRLKKLNSATRVQIDLDGLADAIAGQLKLEEETMDKIGLALTPIHKSEHRKMLSEIMTLEFSWKAKRISSDIYIKALNYKLEFHNHYFDKAQHMLICTGQNN